MKKYSVTNPMNTVSFAQAAPGKVAWSVRALQALAICRAVGRVALAALYVILQGAKFTAIAMYDLASFLGYYIRRGYDLGVFYLPYFLRDCVRRGRKVARTTRWAIAAAGRAYRRAARLARRAARLVREWACTAREWAFMAAVKLAGAAAVVLILGIHVADLLAAAARAAAREARAGWQMRRELLAEYKEE